MCPLLGGVCPSEANNMCVDSMNVCSIEVSALRGVSGTEILLIIIIMQ